MVFDGASGKLLMAFGDRLVKQSEGLGIDGQDNIWLTDIGRHRGFKFAKDGNLLMMLGVQEEAGRMQLTSMAPPTSPWLSPANSTWRMVTGTAASSSSTKNGKFLIEWGKKGSKPG